QVGRDELAVVGLTCGGQVLPASHRAAAPRGTAQAHGGKVVDREVAHGVIERQLLTGADRAAGDEVEGLAGVEANTAVGVAGVVDHRAQAAVARPAVSSDLRRVRVARHADRSPAERENLPTAAGSDEALCR